MGCVAEQLRNHADCARGVAAARKVPEGPAGAGIKAALLGGFDKTRDGLLVSGSEEKRLVKFPAARKLGILWTQSRVFGDFASVHMVESGDADPALLGNVIQRGTDFRIRVAQNHAQVAPDTHGAGDPDIKVAIWKKNPAPALGNKWMAMPHLAPQRLNFRARLLGYQYQGNLATVQLRKGFLRLEESGMGIQQSAVQGSKDQMTRSEQGR